MHGYPTGYPNKSANVAQSSTNSESKVDQVTTISANEYKEYLQLKAAQHTTSSAIVAHTGNSTVCLSHSTPSRWVLDSGGSDHVTGNSSIFSELSPPKYPYYITVADGSKVEATSVGKVSPIPSLSLSSVLLIPNCPFNLISISKLTRSLNCVITFTSDSFLIQDRSTGQTVGVETESRGLYYLRPPTSAVCVAVESPHLLHRLLGHPSLSKLKKMVSDLPQLESLQCESCQLGKHVRVSFPNRINNRATTPFDVVHSDVLGPSRVPSTLGYKYYVTFIDDFSRCTWVF